MQVRARTQLWESEKLSPYASLSAKSKGRVRFQEECPLRTVYQRDRDRITHSKAFRRLKHKTQVFLSPEGDHYRTRLTHTLEVSQIARTIARALLLNEDLTEAIALGHDLGHTPFGHAGERALDALSPDGFRHYEQSVRVVEKLEDLNLTYEVKNGILCHTKGKQADTLEGQVVRIADRIGYINHDIDDADPRRRHYGKRHTKGAYTSAGQYHKQTDQHAGFIFGGKQRAGCFADGRDHAKRV